MEFRETLLAAQRNQQQKSSGVSLYTTCVTYLGVLLFIHMIHGQNLFKRG